MSADDGSLSRAFSLSDAANLLACLGQGAPWVRHCEAVSRVAGALAGELAQVLPLDVAFTERAGLLHDIGRCRTHHPVQHGVVGYRLLMDVGRAAEARVCLGHLLHAFDPADAPDVGLSPGGHLPGTWEERLVPLADFLVEADRPTTLADRFASLRLRYEDNAAFLQRLAASEAWIARTKGELELLLSKAVEPLAARALGVG